MLTECPVCKNDYDNFDTVRCPHCEKEKSMDFILVRQKDYILSLINARQFVTARTCLTVLCELWTKHDYKYKYDELQKRIREYTMGNKKRLSDNSSN